MLEINAFATAMERYYDNIALLLKFFNDPTGTNGIKYRQRIAIGRKGAKTISDAFYFKNSGRVAYLPAVIYTQAIEHMHGTFAPFVVKITNVVIGKAQHIEPGILYNASIVY